MKIRLFSIFLTLFLIPFLLLSNTFAEDYTQMNLPGGAIARFGKGEIAEIKYSQDGTRLAVASGIGGWIYDTSTYQEIDLLTGHTALVKTVAFSPDGNTIATGSWDGTIHVRNKVTGTHKKIFIRAAHGFGTRALVFSPDGKTLVTGSDDDNIRLWDADTVELKQTLIGHTDEVWSVVFSPDGSSLASSSADGSIRLWDMPTGKHKMTFSDEMRSVTSVAFSPDGKTIAAGSGEHTIYLWDADTGEQKMSLGHKAGTVRVAFSPDGNTLVSGSFNGPILLWDAKAGTLKKTLTKTHTGVIVKHENKLTLHDNVTHS
ncbi:WD40 repeat domain-containing protein [Candidatus Poribacteria bacterium]|nr:WD40 repeat domain-containing protein [Candidatus Poribacteria bacterium]MYG05439.1 WD40 repeat domain-containing protein [Candidatus Poribacteria bacterium]MYK23305.1 WD40 repeat domain-containing protein [Candidatus Poribacteria bacterium]